MESEILDIIVKVLKAESSPDERQKLIAWLEKDKVNQEIFKQSESVWNAIEIINLGKEYDVDRAFSDFKKQVSDRVKTSRRIGLYKTIDKFLRIAAIFVIILGVSWVLLYKPNKSIFNSGQESSEVFAPRGSKTQLILSDGTKVWLNSESKITYLNNFNQVDRQIFLEGEGYFEVSKNPVKPFVVHTSDVKITAIGTSFNVKSYPGEETIETTLIEGIVEVESESPEKDSKVLTLEPNQKATYFKDKDSVPEPVVVQENVRTLSTTPSKSVVSQIVLKEKIDPTLMISWKDNVLYFDNEGFQDLAVKLERRFGVNLNFLDENIKQVHFSGKFKDIIIEQVLAALQYASPFYYSIDDKDIYISEKPINPTLIKRINNKKIE